MYNRAYGFPSSVEHSSSPPPSGTGTESEYMTAGYAMMGNVWDHLLHWNAAMSARTCPVLAEIMPEYFLDFPKVEDMLGKYL
jgi:hypothetical protein